MVGALLGLSVLLLRQVGIKEVSQEALHPGGLRVPSRIQSQAQDPRWVEVIGPGLGRVETLDGAGQPDESLETLNVSAAVVHQLVFGDGSAAAGRRVCRSQNTCRKARRR